MEEDNQAHPNPETTLLISSVVLQPIPKKIIYLPLEIKVLFVIGKVSLPKLCPTRKVKAGPKCRFFVWTLMHQKILSTNNLQKKEGG